MAETAGVMKKPKFKKNALLVPRMDISVAPSERFQQLVAGLGGYYQAARAWGVQPSTLRRFLSGGGSLNGQSVAIVIHRTGLKYEALFEHIHNGQGVPNGCA